MSVASVLIQLLQQTLLDAQITSAGGDSPKINRVLYADIQSADFDGVLEAEVRMLVESILQEQMQGGQQAALGGGGLPTVPGESDVNRPESQGFGEAEAVGLARQGLSILQDPTSLVSEGITKLPHAIVIAFAISLLPIIINELTKPGGPFDLRFKRIMDKEFNALMDRQTQYDIRIGERGIIVQSKAGFINANGAASNTNTLRQIREGGINKDFLNEVDYIDHSRGLF